MTSVNINDLVTTVGIIVAAALALATAMGPTVMYLTEALKKAFHVENGTGGLIALVISILLTAVLAVVTTNLTQEGADSKEYLVALGIGAFVGVFVGGGAVQAYKAASSVNPTTDVSSAVSALHVVSVPETSISTLPPRVSDDVDTEPSTVALMAKGPNPDEAGNCFA